MARRGGHFVPRVAGAIRRRTEWVQSADQGFIVVGAATSLIHQSRTFSGGETIVRTRGLLSVSPAASPNDVLSFGAMGIAIVDAQAFAAGAAAIPDPFDEASWDGWFVHQYWTQGVDNTASGELFKPIDRWMIDSKAMRKIIDGTNVEVVMVANASAVGAQVAYHDRELIKLS